MTSWQPQVIRDKYVFPDQVVCSQKMKLVAKKCTVMIALIISSLFQLPIFGTGDTNSTANTRHRVFMQ